MTWPVAAFLIAAALPAGTLLGFIGIVLVERMADSILKLCGYQP